MTTPDQLAQALAELDDGAYDATLEAVGQLRDKARATGSAAKLTAGRRRYRETRGKTGQRR